MNYTDLITIAMPCFERKEYFLEALGSALNQTTKCKVIVVDNCSSHDYYKKICQEKDVTYYRNETNIGLYPNINRCFELAETEYVKILDDDDLLAPNYVESFLEAKKEHPNIDIFFSDFSIISSKGSAMHQHILPFGYMEKGLKIIEYGIKYKLGFPYMSSTIKKSISQDLFSQENTFGSSDWEWVYSTANQYSFFGNPLQLYYYRVHDNQITRTDQAFFALTLPYIYNEILSKNTSDPKMKKKARKHARRALINYKSIVGRKHLNTVLKQNNKYSNYLKTEIHNNILIGIIYSTPQVIVSFIVRSLRKVGLMS